MKRFFTLLFIFCCSLAVMQAQVTLTKKTHGFVPGQVHDSQPIEYQAPGKSGENVVWDFSTVKTVGTLRTSNATSDFEKDPATGNTKVFRSNDQVTFIYNISERGNEYLGYEKDNIKMSYNKIPLLKTQYPQSFGTYFEGKFEGTYSFGDNSSIPVSGDYSTHADAVGTIVLPNGESYQALRVHTYHTLDIQGSVSVTEKYLWYAQDVRLPLFVSIQNFSLKNDGTKILRSQNSYYTPEVKRENAFTDINETESVIAYKVFPNPFQDAIELSYYLPTETKVSIELFDSKGMKLTTLVSQTQSGSVSLTENVSQYAKSQGTYFLKLQFGDKIYSEKLIKK